MRSPRVLRRSDRAPRRRLLDCQDAMGIRLSECNVQQQADGRPDDGLLRDRPAGPATASRDRGNGPPVLRRSPRRACAGAHTRHARTCTRTRTRMFTIAHARTRVCGRCAVMRRSVECRSWGFASILRDFVCEKVLALVSTENVAVRGWKHGSRGIILWDNACCCSKRRGYHPLG